MNSLTDNLYMARALQLADAGRYTTSPNPTVGAVVVGPDGTIIGEGWHRRFGGPHAEVNAIGSVVRRDLLHDSTIYVTLEPCSHYGKTPPCAELIARTGLRRVVVGCLDPNPRVSGRGIDMIRNAGIEVTVGVLEQQCRHALRRFMKAQLTGRPYVTLKWAMSADGFMDRRRTGAHPSAARFSTPVTTLEVMDLRASTDAVLVGSGTVIADNPALTVRGLAGRSPSRVILDRRRRVAPDARVFSADTSAPHVVYVTGGTAPRPDLPEFVDQLLLPDGLPLAGLLAELRSRYGWISLLVEGGRDVLTAFLREDAADEVRVEMSPVSLGCEGVAVAPSFPRGAGSACRVTPEGNMIVTAEFGDTIDPHFLGDCHFF